MWFCLPGEIFDSPRVVTAAVASLRPGLRFNAASVSTARRSGFSRHPSSGGDAGDRRAGACAASVMSSKRWWRAMSPNVFHLIAAADSYGHRVGDDVHLISITHQGMANMISCTARASPTLGMQYLGVLAPEPHIHIHRDRLRIAARIKSLRPLQKKNSTPRRKENSACVTQSSLHLCALR